MQVPGKCDIILLFRERYIVPWHCIVFNSVSVSAGAVFVLFCEKVFALIQIIFLLFFEQCS